MEKILPKDCSLPISFSIDESFKSDRFIKCRARVCHDGICPKKYKIDLSTMEKAQPTIYNIPILAHVIDGEDGFKFGGHDMTLIDDEMHEGEIRCFYEETPIGVVPENCNYQIEEFKGRNYVCVDFYIWRGYSNYAEDIIELLKTIKLSMEINVLRYEYNSTEDFITVLEYEYTGLTLLGNEYSTGMADAQATVVNFSLTEEAKNLMLTMMQELKNVLTFCNTENNKEGGSNSMDMENLSNDTALAEEGEVIIFETAGAVGEVNTVGEEGVAMTAEPQTAEVSPEVPEPVTEEEFIEEAENSESNASETQEEAPITEILSFEEIRNRISEMLREEQRSVAQEDRRYFWIVTMFSNYFIYSENDTRFFKRGYSAEGAVITLEDNAEEVFPQFLTSAEINALTALKENFAKAQEELETLRDYKTKFDLITAEKFKADKEEVFARFEPLLKSMEEFEQLKTDETFTNIQDIENACFTLLGKKSANFALTQPVAGSDNNNSIVKFNLTGDKSSSEDAYGGLFAQYAHR